MYRRNSGSGLGCMAVVVLGVIGLGGVFTYAYYGEDKQVTFTVSDKERVCDSNGNSTDCYYMVFGTEGEVFSNRDELLSGKFDSASIQARFKPGVTYTVETHGWRVPFLSMKPNIVRIVEEH